MKVVKTITEVRGHVGRARGAGKRVGFVPTMGFLHRGHLSLVEEAMKYSEYQVMSIFVNRIQFNDPSDFSSYPQDLDRDFRLAEETGVDLVFLPDEDEIYRNHLTYVNVETMTENLCGAYRPGHFRGVYTVVCKLFNIVQPDVSAFGQKDIQQAVSVEKMVLDLNFPVKIIIAATIREDDGLAMSSRNKHLDPVQRKDALALYRSLARAEELVKGGERESVVFEKEMKEIMEKGNPDKIDYISVVRYSDLSLVERITEKSVIACSAYFGTTRLIDNMIVELEGGGARCIY